MAEAPFDIQQAHRWFAVELNNLAWDLIDKENRTEDDVERMMHAAHASCFHWMQVGTPLHHLRAQCLLTTVYARLDHADSALRHAIRCLELSQQAGDEQTAFDRATAYGCATLAYATAQQPDKAAEMQQKAREVAATFDDPDDKEVFQRLYG